LSYAICRSPVLPLFARHLGAGPALVGVVAGASTVTRIFLKVPAGALSDVLGRGSVLMGGAAVFALLPWAYVPVGSLAFLIALRFVHGSATALFGPVASARLSDLAPRERRGRWLGTYSSIQGAGQALGPVLAGYLILEDFDRAFLASGIIGGVAFLLVARWPVATRESPPGKDRWSEVRRGVGDVVRDRPILTTSLVQAGQFLLHGSLSAFLPLYGSEQLGFDPFQMGMLFGAQSGRYRAHPMRPS
jgi:MFS transporter, DHA1 family, multidrug resistance protein